LTVVTDFKLAEEIRSILGTCLSGLELWAVCAILLLMELTGSNRVGDTHCEASEAAALLNVLV